MQHDNGFEKRTRARVASDHRSRVGVGVGGLETDVAWVPMGSRYWGLYSSSHWWRSIIYSLYRVVGLPRELFAN